MMFYIIILLAAFPLGYLIAYLAKDELVSGRKWFISLAVISVVDALLISLTKYLFSFPSIIALFFLSILCLIAVWKSYDKNFVK